MTAPRIPGPGDKPMMPPTYGMLAVVAMVVVHLVAPMAGLAQAPITWLGVPFVAVGLILNIWAGGLFRRRRTTFDPFAQSRLLVRDGPFLLSRNPMYLGMVLAAIGVAMLLGTLTPFIVVAGLAWSLQARFIVVEEALLEETFGDDYRDYRRQVRRWV